MMIFGAGTRDAIGRMVALEISHLPYADDQESAM
jgi:hypothetical protein